MNFQQKFRQQYAKPGGIQELLYLALPMIISTSCDGIMTFTDRLFLARVDSAQMNASLGGGVSLQVLMFFFVGLIGYSTALVAQYFGANERRNAAKASFQAMLVALVAWPVILAFTPFAEGFYRMMGIPAVQIGYQVEYLNILAWGSIFGLLRYALGCYFTGIGKTKIVMQATLLAMVVNVVLDYILVFGKLGFPAMEIRGAAIATISGLFCAVCVLLVAYFRKENRQEFHISQSFHFDGKIMKKLLHYGYPAGLEMFLNFMAFSAMVSLFHAKGEGVATASTIMFNWDLVSFIPLLGIEIAVTSLVGRYMGACRPQVAHRAALSAVKIGLIYSSMVLFLFVLIPETLTRVFAPSIPSAIFEQAVPIATLMVRIAALYVLVEAMVTALVGALRGAGDTHFTMIASVSSHWLFVPILYLSLNVFNFSIGLSWFLLVLFFFMFSFVLYLRFRSGKWKKIKVIDEGIKEMAMSESN
jgi:multidrug resistance protein, MATE family